MVSLQMFSVILTGGTLGLQLSMGHWVMAAWGFGLLGFQTYGLWLRTIR